MKKAIVWALLGLAVSGFLTVFRHGSEVVLPVALGQFPPGTPQVTQCRLFSTDSERSLNDVHLSPASYFVKVGAKPVLLHLEFTAYAVKGLKPEYASVTVQSKVGPGSSSGRPSLVGPDRYAIDLALVGLSQPYFVLIAFRSHGVWWEFVPKCN